MSVNILRTLLTPYITLQIPIHGATVGSPATHAVRRMSEYNSVSRHFGLFPDEMNGEVVIDIITSIAIEHHIAITPPMLEMLNRPFITFTMNDTIDYTIELLRISDLRMFDANVNHIAMVND